ncbi:hypothetical protein [Paractinoplanes brasiliensis]|uniref:Uncharacterized protein n=1 Tax=Paractinoplanes brasiliensis TaxID=52695 RepID=A0A4R6JZF4_9ACTN|nr:hypothetical protein [Actinoplanes brasiliensis]TDO41292.1 hypothetical protein C8E87_5022 [Actinoplanes brasiliensis]GID27425.1 hypothetical protein Abr02nite_24080 [Actinoplanes brasiliensis]
MVIVGGVAFGLVAGWWLLAAGRPSAVVVAMVALLITAVPAYVAGVAVAPRVAAGLVAGMAAHAVFRWAVRRSVERETPG